MDEILNTENDHILKFKEIVRNSTTINKTKTANNWKSQIKKVKNTAHNVIDKFKNRVESAMKVDFKTYKSSYKDSIFDDVARICTEEEREAIQRWLNKINDIISNPDNIEILHYLCINSRTIAHSHDGITWTINGPNIDIDINTFDDLETILDYIDPETLGISNT